MSIITQVPDSQVVFGVCFPGTFKNRDISRLKPPNTEQIRHLSYVHKDPHRDPVKCLGQFNSNLFSHPVHSPYSAVHSGGPSNFLLRAPRVLLVQVIFKLVSVTASGPCGQNRCMWLCSKYISNDLQSVEVSLWCNKRPIF